MIYFCTRCPYHTTIKCNFDRHKNRKRPCDNKLYTNNDTETTPPNIESTPPNIESIPPNIESTPPNIESTPPNIESSPSQLNTCTKCKKKFNQRYALLRHKKICKGVESKLQCHKCLKYFASTSSKSHHLKTCKATNHEEEEISKPTETPSVIMQPDIDTTNSNHVNIDTSVNKTQNIQINVFGKENLEYLLEDDNLLQRLKSYGKKGVYGLTDIIKEVHCNKEHPENNTIIKPFDYGDGVYIVGDDKEHEYREFGDIRSELIDNITNFFKMYNHVKNNLEVKLVDKREHGIIKNLAYILLSIGGDIANDLYTELDIDDSKVEEDEKILKGLFRRFDKSTMSKLSDYTQANYKREKGQFVKG